MRRKGIPIPTTSKEFLAFVLGISTNEGPMLHGPHGKQSTIFNFCDELKSLSEFLERKPDGSGRTDEYIEELQNATNALEENIGCFSDIASAHEAGLHSMPMSELASLGNAVDYFAITIGERATYIKNQRRLFLHKEPSLKMNADKLDEELAMICSCSDPDTQKIAQEAYNLRGRDGAPSISQKFKVIVDYYEDLLAQAGMSKILIGGIARQRVRLFTGRTAAGLDDFSPG